MIELKHNDKVIIKGRKGTVGTAAGYAAEYNEDPAAAVERAKSLGHELAWVNQEAAMLCAEPDYYERQKEIWSHAIILEDGQRVRLEGETWQVVCKGNYSDMATFTKIEAPATPAPRLKDYEVIRKVTITYTRMIKAENHSAAESIAEDLGTETAHDAVRDSGWRARRAKDGEAVRLALANSDKAIERAERIACGLYDK